MQTIEKESAASVNWQLKGNFLLNATLRQKALEILEQTAFPTTRTEAWKYTRVAKIKNSTLSVQENPITVNGYFGLEENSIQYVFVNGHFSAELSSKSFPDGVKILPLSQMDEAEVLVLGRNVGLDGEIFSSINTAYVTDGLYVHVSAKMQIEPTIEIIQINTGKNILTNLRHVLVAEAFSKVQLIQRSLSVNGTENFTNVISEIHVGKNAYVTIDKLQEEDESCSQISTELVNQHQDSNFTINTVTLNGALVRNNLTIEVDGQNCETHLNGAYILNGNQHVDNHTIVDHKVANCESFELYKGVIDGKATAVFNGKVYVRKDAQKINAFQSNGNVLLSNDATVNSKPELEIYADDVKCSHGSTTGQLDEEAVFYLRARGLSEASARQLMVGAFIEDVIQKIENQAVTNRIHTILKERFNWVIE
ncbi:Fe-S cluster assembly protein SufD [Fluviicola taffensis]|uniref:FeS assembly protein SufD n=1 Tax=Fluviicola taffensis (strain DSM 16823 / NCIMB 13979 / RW262) TaxID=755732 RepID=F2I9B5_FLUTR|nr:Fe-S cluster assembly protein SufD [Fluviicola taffensis]AEA44072.1 FeS assembly protein SufD [Fluviicola taffensis DSM 16823]